MQASAPLLLFVLVVYTVLVLFTVTVFVLGAGVMTMVLVVPLTLDVLYFVRVSADKVVVRVVVLSALLANVIVWAGKVVTLVLETIL